MSKHFPFSQEVAKSITFATLPELMAVIQQLLQFNVSARLVATLDESEVE